ncbi:MAG: Grx4 family monothiol glutaredoxin [Alphaproteobacteria bacterium]|nr:Grx4 family monothiol glutaredoxin [Alphaproteobacteria bacterium]
MINPAVAERIRSEISSHDVVLYMRGTPVFPQCGFSAQAVQILSMLGVAYKAIDVLADPGLHQGIKDFSNWPMLPQLYIKGQFMGGSDIMREMVQEGELQQLLAEKGIPFNDR